MIIFYLLALVVGGIAAVQSGINSSLSRGIDSSLWGTIISFFCGLSVLLLFALITREPMPLKKIATMPAYLFTGGAMGAILVFSMIFLFPKIGPVNIVIFSVFGQMLFSLLIDHYGWFGAPVNQINWQKVASLLLMLVAIFLFQNSRR